MINSLSVLTPEISVSSQYPLWLTLFCLAFGFGLSYFLYRRSRIFEEISDRIRYVLLILRGSYLSVLAFLLISPFVLSRDPEVEKPLLVLGLDNSSSVAHLSDSAALNALDDEIRSFREKLEDRFEIRQFHYGEDVVFGREKSDYADRTTDMSMFYDDVRNKYENRNVALMVLTSDGQYNRGQNPLYYSAPMPFQVHYVALGDTIPRKDLWLGKVRHNRIAFLGNTFEIEVEVGASLLENESSRLQILSNGKSYAEKNLTITNNDFQQKISFEIPADEVGLQRYEVFCQPVEGEVSEANNRKFIYVEVLEGRQEILILTAAPHPDVAAMMSAINTSKNFRARSSTILKFNGNFSDFDLLILNQLPTNLRSKGQLSDEARNIPKLFLLGAGSDIRSFNDWSAGLKIQSFRNQYNEAFPQKNEAFQFFSIDADNAESIAEFPPLKVPFANFIQQGNLNAMYFQKIGKVETEYPLIAFHEQEGEKQGIILGEGIWRWRLYDKRLNGSTEVFDELIQKMVQYLSLREDRSRFRVDVEPSYFENTQVVIGAEYYDKTYELNNDFDARLSLKNEDGETFEFAFLRHRDSYRADLGRLESGEYTWHAELNDGERSYTKEGEFRIKALQLEMNQLQADHSFLYNLAQKQGGSLLYPGQLDQFADEVLKEDKFKPVLHYKERMRELISFPWLLVVFILLFSSEWFIRKWLGLS